MDDDELSGDLEQVAAATLEWLLRAHPDARVGALDEAAETVPLPESLGFPVPEDGVGAAQGLDAVHPDDRVAVVLAWERCRTRGVGQTCARLLTGEASSVHFVNLVASHGIVLVASLPSDAVVPGAESAPPLPPRVCTMRRDEQARIMEVDAAAVDMLGWDAEALVGEASLGLIHPDDRDRGIANWMEMLAVPSRPHRWRGRYQRADGSWMWLDITNHNRFDDPDHHDVLSEMVDISDEMAVHEALREREELLRELTDALPVGVVQFAADRSVVHENEQLRAIVGAGGLLGLLDAAVDEDRGELAAAVDAVLGEGVAAEVEVRLDGDRVCRITLRPLVGEGGAVTGGLACVDDVTEAARLRRELEIRATFDGLTACFSRSAILGALESVAVEGPGTGVVFVDLDRFKPVNDAFGHAAGDQLLAAVGERLRVAVRDIDMVGRLGGDEFLVVCPGVADVDVVVTIARRIADRLAEPLELAEEQLVRPRASIGVAWAPAGTDPASLVARADAAMYESKRVVVDDDAVVGGAGAGAGEGQPGSVPNSPTKLTISPG